MNIIFGGCGGNKFISYESSLIFNFLLEMVNVTLKLPYEFFVVGIISLARTNPLKTCDLISCDFFMTLTLKIL